MNDTIGVIVEYNPLHLGHVYHLTQSKELANTKSIIAVMSGNWVQRGEPAIINKWERTKLALTAGVDLVLELPFLWACQSAREFARGGVKLLDKTGITTYQSFGSESGDLTSLTRIADLLIEEPAHLQIKLKEYLAVGFTYSKSLSLAINDTTTEAHQVISPNDILGIEYLRALIEQKSTITPISVNRQGSDYHDMSYTNEFSSATAIRSRLFEGKSVNTSVPYYTKDALTKAQNNNGLVFMTDLEQILLYRLRASNIDTLTTPVDWEVGLENRVKKAAMESVTFKELISKIKTKRYTHARIQRYLIHLILGLDKETIKKVNKLGPPYLRVLGMTDAGKNILKQMKTKAGLPIISRPGRDVKQLTAYGQACFEWEVRATALYNLLTNKQGNEDYLQPVIH